jgi:hypothetical protein
MPIRTMIEYTLVFIMRRKRRLATFRYLSKVDCHEAPIPGSKLRWMYVVRITGDLLSI